ncbi:transposase [Actinomyces haliotis]|uniref:transposase n=1 Tax=Actinomyces haliotis TaxID=1280843 RepID=UPI0018906C74|nr:transposase [Actinomyces haliotis]
MPQKYTPEFKARALQLIEERVQAEQCSGWVACTAVGEALGGVSPHTLRNWWKQNRIDRGQAPGVTSQESDEMRRLRRENLELRRANEILRKASAFFAAELDRPTTR